MSKREIRSEADPSSSTASIDAPIFAHVHHRLVQKPEPQDIKRNWRRDRDSNPGYAFTHTRFPSVRLKPLGHLSGMGTALASRALNELEPEKPAPGPP